MELLVPLGCYLYSARKVDNTGYSSLISNAHNLKNYILVTMNDVIGVIAPVGGRWPHGRRYYSRSMRQLRPETGESLAIFFQNTNKKLFVLWTNLFT